MADNQTKTTSSRTFVESSNDQTASPPPPKSGEAQTANKLTHNLSDSYQLVKQRQRKYNALSVTANADKMAAGNATTSSGDEAQQPWLEVCSAKNKLKRKKKLSASLTSVTDTVNQEKRTRIEGIQLNCRGKLPLQELTASATHSPTHSCVATPTKAEKAAAKPPVPPAATLKNATPSPCAATMGVQVPPPRLKRKLEQNVQTIQKLNALTEQLRLEINELKCSLNTERGAVRVLRAQNECETRKWKNEVKKLQNALELLKKSNTLVPNSAKRPPESLHTNAEILPSTAASSLANYEIQRLTNEIIALKEANKAVEEKKSLEELKTKERNIGQLKKELQNLQAKPQTQQNETKNKSRNATTKLSNKTTNYKTTNKPKKSIETNRPQSDDETTISPQKEETNKNLNLAQSPHEMKKLKDIELINNTKNLQNNHVNLKTTKILNNSQSNKLKPLDTQTTTSATTKTATLTTTTTNNENANNLLKTTTMTCVLQQKDYHSMPHEITERLIATNATTNSEHEYKTKDNNSDSDSALSSAPPSISPQPPPAGLETTDIWQMIRTYTTDIEKLQNDVQILQKENEQLQAELNLAKEQILETEKTAMEANNNVKLQQLMERIKFLEEQEHQLQAESAELREQNELLEFRVLELEETNDKWSLQSPVAPNTNSSTNNATTTTTPTMEHSMRNVWDCDKPHREDPMQMLFGSRANMDSGIASPHSERPMDDELNLMDTSNEELRRRIQGMLKKPSLEEEDKQCLQQLLSLVQQLDALSQRSGPDSLNTTSSSDEASSLDLVKSRISDYSSASSSSSARSAYDLGQSPKATKCAAHSTNSRIVATVLPYNSSPQHQQPIHAPTNTPTDSPRKSRQPWQSTSLSESGVFVESDFLSDASEQNACTQTDFDEEAKELCSEFQRLQRYDNKAGGKVTAPSANLNDHKRLLYYKERLELLESKVLIYESSGDLQTKRLADRLQREIQLVKQLKELQDRVEYLESENSTLEEEKCEFEEAENDTRLRLQRLEVELEILSQRNVELEMSREALSAKYKDCRSECLILRDDLSVSETQIRHLEEDKQKAKENLEFLHSALPLLLFYSSVLSYAPAQKQAEPKAEAEKTTEMGNLPMVPMAPTVPGVDNAASDKCNCNDSSSYRAGQSYEQCDFNAAQMDTSACQQRESAYLKEEIKCLRHKLKELNARHYEALESADSHWVDIEREYKDREESFRAKEMCLKQKIQKLQDCLRDDARAANEKIVQLEDAEKELKCCLLRISKEHREIIDEQQNVISENERLKDQYEQLKEQQKPLTDALEQEKKRNKSLADELNFMRKLQQETDARGLAEMDALRMQLFDLKREFLHIEVTNSELKEEVATLEQQIEALQNSEKENVDKIRCLQDEVRSKEEMCQKLEKRLEHSEGYSLAQELSGSPSKRFKREDIKDLKSASQGLGKALRNMKECESTLPSHQQFQSVARDVKKLADVLLHGDSFEEEILQQIEEQINEELMNFHSRKMESEFYCTVYYPVKRQVPLDITDFLIK